MDVEPNWSIRSEQGGDAEGIDAVLRRAFLGANAAHLVRSLRAQGGYDPDLSLVAVERGPPDRIIGHVLFSPVAIVHGDAPSPALALGPLGVAPSRQRIGVGSALVQAGLARCRERRLSIVLVVGDPGYYARFGFVPASSARIQPPYASWAAAYQVLELLPGALRDARGLARYPAPWDEA